MEKVEKRTTQMKQIEKIDQNQIEQNIASIILQIKLLDQNVKDPLYLAYENDACADIRSNMDKVLNAKEFTQIKTGFAMAIPQGYEGLIRSRSGLALKHGIAVLNSPGTIDAGYRGEVGVILINHSMKPFKIKKGMRIAQMAIREVVKVYFKFTDDLSGSDRGKSGFGSSGIK